MENIILDYFNLKCYPIIIAGLFISWLFFKSKRKDLSDFLESVNMISLVMGGIFLIATWWDIDQLIEFSERIENAFGYSLFMQKAILAFFVLGLGIRKFRRSWIYSLGLGIFLLFEPLVVIITSLHRDFLPTNISSFRFYFDSVKLQSMIVLVCTLILHQLIKNKDNNL